MHACMHAYIPCIHTYIHTYVRTYLHTLHTWVSIKIQVPGKGTIADQPRINRDPKGDNRGGILFFPMAAVQKIKIDISIDVEIYTSHKPVQRSIL